MGVLNFSGPLRERSNVDILSLEAADIDLQHDLNDVALQNINISPPNSTTRPTKRKRTKSVGKSSYDFRDFGIDCRRQGSKHQRRKQNLFDLLQMNGNEDDQVVDDDWSSDDHMTLFTELFLDESKMKAWENFVMLSEDKQKEYLETTVKKDPSSDVSDSPRGDYIAKLSEENQYHRIDDKIRDMLRSKKLANMGLLEYFEDDVLCVVSEEFPSVVVLNLDSSYDRMLVYALCQYMGLASNTIKLKNLSMVEIDLPTPSDNWRPPPIKLSEYLKNKLYSKTK